jgi:FdhD protein
MPVDSPIALSFEAISEWRMPVDAVHGALPDPCEFPLALEEAVKIVVDGACRATIMCTPCDLDVLALGNLLTRGAIASRNDVASIRTEKDAVCVRLRRASANSPIDSPSRSAASTQRGPLPRGEPFVLASIQSWVREMFDRADIRKGTGGGMHSAGLADRMGLRWIYEDVGRQNAVDKAIGRGLAERIDFTRCCLLCSGRIAAEMAAKAVAAGIPILASRSIPTTAAYEIAVQQSLTMIGRITTDAPVVYTGSERLA